MTPEILQTLKRSIEHWERLSEGKRRPCERIGPKDCALCQLFRCSCVGCPVMERTGFDLCTGTPYEAASDALDNEDQGVNYNDPRFLKAAKAELDFLRSLLPK